MRSRGRLAASLAAVLSLVSVGPIAAQPAAKPSEQRCLAAYEQGQRLRLKHALVAARAELLLCAREPCPASFRPECLQWFDQVQLLVPSVIIHVDGDPAATDVRVSIDGVIVAQRLDGTPIEVDPGEHVFRFEPRGREAIEQKVLINEGQKARLITIPARPLAVPPPRANRTSWTPWVFAGISGVALGSFAYFGATGMAQRHELDLCHPACDQADIDSTHRRFLVADASLAISAITLGIATYLWWTAQPAKAGDHVRVEASGGPGGAYLGVTGAF